MFTAIDYHEKNCTHHEYWGQFVNNAVKNRVENSIGLSRILASTDEHLNDIPLAAWDRLGLKDCIDTKLFKAAHNVTYREKDRNLFLWSMSCNVCIAKAAARILIKENK